MEYGWALGLLWNGIIGASFTTIGVILVTKIHASQQWTTNPLATATAFIFLTCGGGHAVHFLQLMLPVLGVTTAATAGARIVYSDTHLLWDAVTAATGVWYLSMRKRFPALVRGTAMFEDLRERQRRAIEINDDVVQTIARAKLALEVGEEEEGSQAVSDSLAASKRIISDLLGRHGDVLEAGALRRAEAAGEAR